MNMYDTVSVCNMYLTNQCTSHIHSTYMSDTTNVNITRTHARMHACTHTRTHARTHTHTHTVHHLLSTIALTLDDLICILPRVGDTAT